MGSEPGGWLRYLIETGTDIPAGIAHKGIYAARLEVTDMGMTGGAPGAGNYMMDLEYTADVVFSQPFFQAGAPSNYGTDPYGRGGFFSRMRILARIRPVRVPDAATAVSLVSANWSIYRIT
ncbi:MAG: hypothetical protein AB7G13_31950 [Lautropia sp.]